MKKYELIELTATELEQIKQKAEKKDITIYGSLYHVVALVNIIEHGVTAGQRGGMVSGAHNLSTEGAAWVGENAIVLAAAQVLDDALVTDSAWVSGNAVVREDVRVSGEAQVSDYAGLSGFARVEGKACVFDSAWAQGRSVINGTATVCGDSLIRGYALITDDAYVTNTSVITDNAIVGGETFVSLDFINSEIKGSIRGNVVLKGASRIDGYVNITDNVRVIGEGVVITDSATISGDAVILGESHVGEREVISRGVINRAKPAPHPAPRN